MLPVPKHTVDLMHDRYRRVPFDGKFFLSKHISEPVMLMCFEQMAASADFFLKHRKVLPTMRPTFLVGSMWALYWSAEYIGTIASRCTFERKHAFCRTHA